MLSWVSVNALDGSIIADLPDLLFGGKDGQGSLKRTIGRSESQSALLPLDGAPGNWDVATRKKSVFLVALSDPLPNEPRGVPVWGGMVTGREPDEGSYLWLEMATAEDYLNDRYVRDETFFTWPQNDIVEYLVNKYAAADGLPIRVVKLPGANPVRGRTYLDADDKTLYSVLDEIAGIEGGPEWTIEWEWVDERKLGLVFYVGARVGSPAPAGLGPASWFHLPGNVQKFRLTDSYKRGEGANDVMATSSGSADARPQSDHHVYALDGRPKVEFRWTPSTSITEIATLTDHASRALGGMKNGLLALSIVATTDETTPFSLGDDVGFDIRCPAYPSGISGTARVLSIEWTNKTTTPVLDVRGIEGIS